MEKALVQHDLEYYANSKTMIGSLNTALSEFAMIERQLAKVDDPEQYKATDQSFGLAKNRSKGLPLDEARQIFKSHFTRLVNLDKSPLDDLEKQIIEARKSAILRAQQQYIERQARTLGVACLQQAGTGRQETRPQKVSQGLCPSGSPPQNPTKRMTRLSAQAGDGIPFDAPRPPSPAGAVPRPPATAMIAGDSLKVDGGWTAQ